MNLSRDIHPLTDFKRNTSEFLAQLNRKHDVPPHHRTDGRASKTASTPSYSMGWIPARRSSSPEYWEVKKRKLAERLETIRAARESLASADRGEGRPMDDVFDELEQGPPISR